MIASVSPFRRDEEIVDLLKSSWNSWFFSMNIKSFRKDWGICQSLAFEFEDKKMNLSWLRMFDLSSNASMWISMNDMSVDNESRLNLSSFRSEWATRYFEVVSYEVVSCGRSLGCISPSLTYFGLFEFQISSRQEAEGKMGLANSRP